MYKLLDEIGIFHPSEWVFLQMRTIPFLNSVYLPALDALLNMVAIHLAYESYLSLPCIYTSSKPWLCGTIKWMKYTWNFYTCKSQYYFKNINN